MGLITVVAALAVFTVLAVGALLVSMRVEHGRVTVLPTPTGPLPTGRALYAWSDPAQVDALAPEPGTKRELLAWVWYPAAPPATPATVEDYLPPDWRTAVERLRGALITGYLTRDLSRVRVHSLRDAHVSSSEPAYPVVILRAGLAALTAEYTTLAEDLASHGYVVVGFDAPYRTAVVVFPDGRVVKRTPENDPELVSGPAQDRLVARLLAAWSADIGFALDQLARLDVHDPTGRLTGRLDLDRVGVLGHSLGGAAALQFCQADPRCRAGIDVDGAPYGSVIEEGVTRPFMFLLSDRGSAADAETRRIEADIQSIYGRLPSERRLRILMRGANHFNYSDGAVLKSQLLFGALRAVGIVGLDGRRQLALTARCIGAFFDVHLKRSPASDLDSRLRDPDIRKVD